MNLTDARVTTGYRNSGGAIEVAGKVGSGGYLFVTYTHTTSIYNGVTDITGFSNLRVGEFEQTAPIGPIGEKAKSPEQAEYENRKLRLIDAVTAMRRSAPNWSGEDTHVRDSSAYSAKKFLECLPGNAVLPRVAPDGEGDIMFVWDGAGQQSCVVTVEKQQLHLACGLGTPEAKHVDAKRFLGLKIPKPILDRIPHR